MITKKNATGQEQVQKPSSSPEMDEMKKRVKYGGRTAGTPNKVTTMTKGVIASLLNDYQESGLMGSDFLELEPKERIAVAEKLMQYVMPKMQNTSVDFNATSGARITIEQKLREKAQAIENKD